MNHICGFEFVSKLAARAVVDALGDLYGKMVFIKKKSSIIATSLVWSITWWILATNQTRENRRIATFDGTLQLYWTRRTVFKVLHLE
jgi:hypothetical protein